MTKALKLFAILVFGIVIPCFVVFQAYLSAAALRDDVSYTTQLSELPQYVDKAHNTSWSANDYALFSLLYVEHANQKTMINKQRMKTSIINIGFGVLSIGMMLILLGIEGQGRSGLSGGVSVGDVKFDLKTGSTGVGLFVVGAIVATLGGVLKNDYQTSQIPQFGPTENARTLENYNKSLQAYKSCNQQKSAFELCFTQIFYQINKGNLQ